MAEPELNEMLAKESDRRVPAVKKGLSKLAKASEPNSAKVEEMRVEVHGLKGAAMVIGQNQLGRLAERAEQLLTARAKEGTIDADLAARLSAAMDAFQEGSKAAADGDPEPPSVSDALVALA